MLRLVLQHGAEGGAEGGAHVGTLMTHLSDARKVMSCRVQPTEECSVFLKPLMGQQMQQPDFQVILPSHPMPLMKSSTPSPTLHNRPTTLQNTGSHPDTPQKL